MIISKKQIMQLITMAHMYRAELLQSKILNNLSSSGNKSLKDTADILEKISNQQSEELKVIE